MLIERNGVEPELTFKDLAQGDPFVAKGSVKETLMMKCFQFQGVGQCAVNMSNGAIVVIEKDAKVVRVNAKVVI